MIETARRVAWREKKQFGKESTFAQHAFSSCMTSREGDSRRNEGGGRKMIEKLWNRDNASMLGGRTVMSGRRVFQDRMFKDQTPWILWLEFPVWVSELTRRLRLERK
jgi:hypothetical protein